MKLIFAIAFALLFAACANATPASPTNLPVNPSAVPTNETLPQATPATLPDDVLVVYRKHGGIAGIDETLTVGQGGFLELTTRDGTKKSLKVDEPMVQPIRRMLEQKEFGALQPLYQAAGADLFTYTVTARDANGKIKTVTTMDAAPTPPYLGQLIAMLDQLRNQVK